ncbi:hypothetical protein KM043_003887 [Ampulex compressa]|nr:hypothetical protein KM043_003887 [Ampulex compressa]
MEGPGLSLFQDSEGIRLNASTQGLEEDEEQEDIKRRNEEIKDLLTNAFDDLDEDEDDVSSVNSSHYQDSAKEDKERSNNTVNLSARRGIPSKELARPRFRNEFEAYDHSKNHYENATTIHGIGTEDSATTIDPRGDFNPYARADTPCRKFNESDDPRNITAETPYELARPPLSRFPHDAQGPPEEGYTFDEVYPLTYETPANHYDARRKGYSDNGYIDEYQTNSVRKPFHEFGGGGDNVSSDHSNHCYKTSPNGRTVAENAAYKMAEYGSKEQLEVLYTVRVREVERLTEGLRQLQSDREEEKNQLNRKLTVLQAEVERSNISRNQAQHVLVDANAKIIDLEKQVTSLREKNAVLEKTNENMTEELNIARDSVIELQQKITILERVQALQTTDKTHEKFLKQAQEKHAVEMKNMQTQIDVLTEKLSSKETSYVALENKLADVRRAHEALMVEKGDTMNRLAQALEESQAQCRTFMAANNAQEAMKLEARIKILIQDKEEMQRTIRELQGKLQASTSNYDSLLATTMEDESDSIRQMKLGEAQSASRFKPSEEMANKLRSELQRCLAGQTVKRKEINRLENTLSQKERELDKALAVSDACRQEAARYAKRVNELEQELKSLLTDQAMKANAQIQKLSDHLNDVKRQCELLREEKVGLEEKLEEKEAANREASKRLLRESARQQETESIEDYNKEYLEIHAKALERVRQEARMEVVQLTVQLEQTQKELDRVKELYIDVCGTKEQLANEHKAEAAALKERYANLEGRLADAERLEMELQTQTKLVDGLRKECEAYRAKVMEAEKELGFERKRKEGYTKRIHEEIERAKEEALEELRSAHPNREISVLLPDRCSDHLEKITRLEEDCARLEEQLRTAVEEQERLSEYQGQLDEARLKLAQMEIAQESWKRRQESAAMDKKELLRRISRLEAELATVRGSAQLSENVGAPKRKCEEGQPGERGSALRERIAELEAELAEARRAIEELEGGCGGRPRRNSVGGASGNTGRGDPATDAAELSLREEDSTATPASDRSNGGRKGECRRLEQRAKQLERRELEGREEERLERLTRDLEAIRSERDQLVRKLKNQAMQFEQYVRSQRQVSAELLHASPVGPNNDAGGGLDLVKMRERTMREVREEMEEKVIEELRGIEEQHRERRKELEEKYKRVLLELQARCNEKTREVEALREAMLAEKDELRQRENDVEEERNLMAQVMTKWAAEMRDAKAKEVELEREMERLKEREDALRSELRALQESAKETKSTVDTLKQKYQAAKKTANNYKEHAENKEKFLLGECRRIEEGYKRAMNQVQEKLETIVSAQEEQVATKLKELERQYAERIEQMRLTLKYKSKC